jgi:hypothetical protein
MEYLKIGQGITFSGDIKVLTNLTIRKGDKGIVACKVCEGQAEVRVTSGEAYGKRVLYNGNISDDHDVEAIAGRMASRISREFLDNDSDSKKEVQNIIEAALSNYL